MAELSGFSSMDEYWPEPGFFVRMRQMKRLAAKERRQAILHPLQTLADLEKARAAEGEMQQALSRILNDLVALRRAKTVRAAKEIGQTIQNRAADCLAAQGALRRREFLRPVNKEGLL